MTFKKITKLPIELKSLNLKEVELAMGIVENAELSEAKRYVRRYYMKPQNIFCSNKTDILKALIDIDDQNSTIYTLNNLGDIKDVSKLTATDVIYHYEDGILYDKNYVKIMDYDLSVKHEEERKKFGQNIEAVSDAEFAKVYDDRITDLTKTDEVKENLEKTIELTENVDFKNIEQKKMFNRTWKDKFNTMLAGKTLKFGCWKRWGSGYSGYYQTYTVDHVFVGANSGNLFIKANDAHNIAVQFTLNNFDQYGKRNKKHLELKNENEHNELLDLIAEYEQDFNATAKSVNAEDRVVDHAEEKLDDQVNLGKDIAAKANISDTNWLADNVIGLKFTLPSTERAIDAPKTLGKRLNQIKYSLEKRYPGITSDSKHFEIIDKPAESSRSYYGFWGLNGTVTFKVPFASFPEIIKDMVANAINTSKAHGHNWVNDTVNEASTKISNIYLCFAILDLFDDDYTFCDKNSTNSANVKENPFNQNFDNYNAYGEKVECLRESKEGEVCCICGEPLEGYGNNPEPYKHEGRCCDACNLKFVIPARLDELNKEGK